MASIAQGYLPEKSSRMKVADGVKRFKFKSANLESTLNFNNFLYHKINAVSLRC